MTILELRRDSSEPEKKEKLEKYSNVQKFTMVKF